MRTLVICLFISIVILSCDTQDQPEEGKLQVVCTTGMIGDAASAILGDHAEVHILMGPGVDPHLYKATQGDIQALTRADVIIYNGLHLEGKMGDILEKLRASKQVYAMGDGLNPSDLINSTSYAGAFDPHIWFDVSLWERAVVALAHSLAADYPEFSPDIEQHSERYADTLKVLHDFVLKEMQAIPKEQRVLITAHDAFKYFGRAYDIEVRGLQGISTASEYGLRDISDLVRYVSENNIRSIFVESSVPKRSVEAVIEGASKRGHSLQLGGELFSDAMGSEGSPEGSYTGMVQYNVRTIVNALK